MKMLDKIKQVVHDMRRKRGETVSPHPSPIRPEIQAALNDLPEPENADEPASGVFMIQELAAGVKAAAKKAGTTCKVRRNGQHGGNGELAAADLADDLGRDTSDEEETSVDFRLPR